MNHSITRATILPEIIRKLWRTIIWAKMKL